MNRRDFFRVVSSAAIAVSIPVALIAELENPLFSGKVGAWSGITFEAVTSEMFDYGLNIAVAMRGSIGEKAIRRAVLLPTNAWKNFTEDQREDIYSLIKSDIAMRLKAGV